MALQDDILRMAMARGPQRNSNAYMFKPLGARPGQQFMGFKDADLRVPAPAPAPEAPSFSPNFLKLAAGAAGVGAIAQAGLGVYQMYNQKRLADRFDKQEKATFAQSLNPLNENKDIYERQARQGLSTEAEALARSNAASQSAGQFRAASELSGGQLGSALGRIGAMNTTQLGLSLGVQDQQARERAQAGIAGVNREISQVQRMDIQRKQRMEDMTMQQIAGLRQDSMQNISGAVGGFTKGLSNLAYIQQLEGSENNPSAADFLS